MLRHSSNHRWCSSPTGSQAGSDLSHCDCPISNPSLVLPLVNYWQWQPMKLKYNNCYYTFSTATLINKNTSKALSPCWEEWPEKNWDCCLATTEIQEPSGFRSLMLNLTLSTLYRVRVWVSRCIQTSFFSQLGISDCGGMLNVTKIEMQNFGENPLSVRTSSTHSLLSRRNTKQRGSNFFMTVLFLKGGKEKQVHEQEKAPSTDCPKEGRAKKWKSPQS